jgi:hypothetical protein
LTKSRMFQVIASFAIVVFIVCGQQALAQDNHPRFQIKLVPRANPDGAITQPDVAPPANLYGLQAAFTQGYPTIGANSDHTDIWPCFGSASGNPDCPTIGSPSITFPAGGAALGAPAYVWQLSNPGSNGYGCNSDTNGTSNTSYLPCGQTETWYEDITGDSTDDLTYSIVVTQGTNILVDSGIVDFGTNVFGGATPPADVVVYGDQNFGTWPGAGAGPNNANCTADFNYPLTSDPPTVFPYIIQANKTCKDPVAGAATLTAITEVATPHYTKVLTVAGCKPVAPPCWTVKYTKKYALTQKWTIFFE